MKLEEIKQGVTELKKKLVALMSGKVECATVKTDKAVLIYDTEELAPGVDVFVEDEEGNRTPAPNGDYATEDNMKIVVADGKVSEIVEIEPEGKAETETEMSEDSPSKEESAAMMTEVKGLCEVVRAFVEKNSSSMSALDERLAKVEKMAAGEHPTQTYRHNTPMPKTGDAKLDARLERVNKMFRKE